jgi:soluble lytic murein transglycosylase
MEFKTKTRLTNSLFLLLLVLFFSLIFLYKIFPLKYISEINIASKENNIDSTLIAATIKMESGFDEMAVSSSGAFGLMQLMPDTANWLYSKNIISGNWREPAENIMMGTYYLRSLVDRFDDNVEIALNGYHKGPNKVQRLLNNSEPIDMTYSERILIYKAVYEILYNKYFVNSEN